MKPLKILCSALLLVASGIPEARGEGESKLAIESASAEQFTLLLKKIKSLHSKGAATYTSAEIREDWLLFKPLLIVVRHDHIEFFLNSDLAAPVVLEFSRMTGLWSPINTRWTACLRRPGKAEPTELWSRTDLVSNEEWEAICKYDAYRDSLERVAQQAAPSESDKPAN